MIRIVLDPQTVEKLHGLAEPLELCDTSGRLLARAIPVVDLSECDPVSPDISEEELSRRITSQERRFTTQEVLKHLGQH